MCSVIDGSIGWLSPNFHKKIMHLSAIIENNFFLKPIVCLLIDAMFLSFSALQEITPEMV